METIQRLHTGWRLTPGVLRAAWAFAVGCVVLLTSCSRELNDLQEPHDGTIAVTFDVPQISGSISAGDDAEVDSFASAVAAVPQTRATLAENTTVRVIAYKGGTTPSGSNFMAEQSYYISGGKLVPCTVDANGKFVAVATVGMRLLSGSYDFYAISPALPLGIDKTTMTVANGVDFAASPCTPNISFLGSSTAKVTLAALDRKCAQVKILVKKAADYDALTALSVPSDGKVTFRALTASQSIPLAADVAAAAGAETYDLAGTAFTATDATTSHAVTYLLPRASTHDLQIVYDLSQTKSGVTSRGLATGSAGKLALEKGKSYLLTLTVSKTSVAVSVTVADWIDGGNQHNGMGAAYPLVVGGKTIIAKDLWGKTDGTIFHTPWTAAKMPRHDDQSEYNAVSESFEVATSNCNKTNTPSVIPDSGTDAYTWTNALAVCAAYSQVAGDVGNWRLPTVAEVAFFNGISSKLNVDPLAPAYGTYYWSSSEFEPDPEGAANNLYISGGSCDRTGAPKADTYNVRCVRDSGLKNYPYVVGGTIVVAKDADGQTADTRFHTPWTAATMPRHDEQSEYNAVSESFEVATSNCNNTNTPSVTPDSGTDAYTWTNALAVCAAYSQVAGDVGNWRLPTVAEVAFFNGVSSKLTVDPLASASGNKYWSSSEFEPYPEGYANNLYISPGYCDHASASKAGTYNVRCVRDL